MLEIFQDLKCPAVRYCDACISVTGQRKCIIFKNCSKVQQMVFQRWTLQNNIDSRNGFQESTAFVGIFRIVQNGNKSFFRRTLLSSIDGVYNGAGVSNLQLVHFWPHKKPFSSMELIFAAKTTPPLHQREIGLDMLTPPGKGAKLSRNAFNGIQTSDSAGL